MDNEEEEATSPGVLLDLILRWTMRKPEMTMGKFLGSFSSFPPHCQEYCINQIPILVMISDLDKSISELCSVLLQVNITGGGGSSGWVEKVLENLCRYSKRDL